MQHLSMGMAGFAFYCLFFLKLAFVTVSTEVKKNVWGNSESEIVKRIINGEVVKPGEYPWMVAFRYKSTRSLCGGGMLINENYVLTAAHLFPSGSFSQLHVDIGGTNLDGEDGWTARKVDIAEVNIYPGYNYPVNLSNDIALVRLAEPVSVSSFACLPNDSYGRDLREGQNATTAGWGAIDRNDVVVQHLLKKVDMAILSNSFCQFPSLQKHPETAICAGDTFERVVHCEGDSGGPLMMNSVVVGIVSGGLSSPANPECIVSSGIVYTRVSYYLNWIKEHTSYQVCNIYDDELLRRLYNLILQTIFIIKIIG